MDPDTRRLMMFAGGLGAVLVVLIGASAIVNRHKGEVPVITADTRPIREKPVNPGGMKIDGAENDVFSGGSDTANSKLAPRAENPDTKALRSAAVPPPAVAEAPAPVAVAPPPPAANKPAAVAVVPPAATKPGAVAVVPPTAKSAAAPPPPVVTKSTLAAINPPLAKPTPVQPATAETHAAPAGHQPMVQLAALTSAESARNEWQMLTQRMPDLLKGHQPIYARTERDGRTFWRVRTSGFTDLAQARAFCDHVRAKGAGCSVADF